MRCNDIMEAIGRTPLVRLNRMSAEGAATVYAKLESSNPGGSVKDRIAMAMVLAAENDGRLKAGWTIVEPTSGNTGIGLAIVAAARGYKCILAMPETMSIERRALLKQLGATIVLTPGPEGMKGAIAKAEELASDDTYFMPAQFNNPANPEIHRMTTGPEIIEDLGDIHLDVFVAGVGTGGTLSGAGKALKDRYGCQVVAVEPEASAVLSGGDPGPHPIQGIGGGFVPENYDSEIVDRIITVSVENALTTARQMARQEGILAGVSSGASVWAALKMATELGHGKTVVVIVPDTGERYLSTALFEEQE